MRRTKAKGVPVTIRALVQRINRKLAADGEILKASRGERARKDLGEYFVLNVRAGTVTKPAADPEGLGRRLGVLRTWEHLVVDD